MTTERVQTYEVGQLLYRVTVKRNHGQGYVDYNGELRTQRGYYGRDVEIFHVRRVTPKGAWIRSGKPGDTIFSAGSSRRGECWIPCHPPLAGHRFATTPEDANQDAIARYSHQKWLAQKRLDACEDRLRVLVGHALVSALGSGT